jgi:hypothetical protein
MPSTIKISFVIVCLFLFVVPFAVAQTETDISKSDVIPAPADNTEVDTPKTDAAPTPTNDAVVDPARDQILLELENIKSSIDKNTPSEKAYDEATAPGQVSLTILDKNGLPPAFQTFVSFIAVGGKTYGGAVDKDGLIAVTLPSGRYYVEILSTDPNQVAPPDLPGFFLEPEDALTFGPFFLQEKTEPTKEEKQIQAKLEEPSGLASILSTIMHLLGEILKEVRK